MDTNNYEYILLLLVSFSVPFLFLLTHRKRIKVLTGLQLINQTVLYAAVPFVVWDIVFTATKIWAFNPDYTTGINLFYLPIEEYLFFIFIPQSCLLVWAALKRYTVKGNIHKDFLYHINLLKKIA